MAERTVWFDAALLADGWAEDVSVVVEGGLIRSVTTGTRRGEHMAGAALPGLPNLHSHCFQRGMAGLAERRGPTGDSFWTWRQVMYRFNGLLDPDDVEAIAAMAMVEMLEGGFTSLAEFHYLHHGPDGRAYANPAELGARIVAAAAETGIGLTLLPVFYAHSGFGGAAPNEGQRRFINSLDDFAALHAAAAEAVRTLPGGQIGIAPHSLRAVTPDELSALLAVHREGPVHIHVAEQTAEVEACVAWSGQRPVDWLLGQQPVDARWCLIHATHMTAAETAGLARSGAVAGLCPITEANLGDGIFEGVAYADAGGAFGVGSDSNVEITAAGELKLYEYGQRLKHRGRNLLAAAEGDSTGAALYRAALAGGAQALGQPCGGIAPGLRADFVVLDTDHPALATVPRSHWLDAYVFVAGAQAIACVIAGGKTVVEHGRHVTRTEVARRFIRRMERFR